MTNSNGFAVNPGWRVLLKDVGINVTNILRRAGLPDDLFSRENTMLSTDEYFRFWKGIEEEADDPLLRCMQTRPFQLSPLIHLSLRPCAVRT